MIIRFIVEKASFWAGSIEISVKVNGLFMGRLYSVDEWMEIEVMPGKNEIEIYTGNGAFKISENFVVEAYDDFTVLISVDGFGNVERQIRGYNVNVTDAKYYNERWKTFKIIIMCGVIFLILCMLSLAFS